MKKEDLLSKIRKNIGKQYDMPSFDDMKGVAFDNPLEQFIDIIGKVGGRAVVLEDGKNVNELIKSLYPEAKEIASNVEGITIATKNPDTVAEAKELNGIKLIAAVLPLDAQGAKDIAFQLRAQFAERLAVVLGCHADGKPSLTVCFSDDLVAEGQNAGKMVREAGRLIQGGGGGQAHFATAGGKNPDGLSSAVDKIVELIQG